MIHRYFPLIFFFLICGFLLIGLKLDPRKLPSNLKNKEAPRFSLPDLMNKDVPFSNSDLKGQLSLVNVWATWCLACREDHLFLMKLAKQGVPIYGLDYKDSPHAARRWLDDYGNPYIKVGSDIKGMTAINWGVYGTPETFLLDKRGVIRLKHVGPLTQRAWNEDFMPLIKALRDKS